MLQLVVLYAYFQQSLYDAMPTVKEDVGVLQVEQDAGGAAIGFDLACAGAKEGEGGHGFCFRPIFYRDYTIL